MVQKARPFIPTRDVLLIILGLITIFYTIYQTAQGLKSYAGGTIQGIVFAFLIGLSLAILSINLRSKLKRGNKAGAFIMLGIYLFIAGLSFAPNFNRFYSEGLKQQLISEDIENFQLSVSKLKSESSKAFDQLPNEVSKLQTVLNNQILDPVTPGWGIKTQRIADALSNSLGVKITKPGGDPVQMSNSVTKQINDLLKIQTENITNFKDSFDSKIAVLNKQIEATQATLDPSDDKKAVKDSINTYNSLCTEAKVLSGNNPIIECNPIVFKNEQIGTIMHSFYSAVERPADAAVPFLQTAFIDLILPFMILVSSFSETKRDLKFPERN